MEDKVTTPVTTQQVAKQQLESVEIPVLIGQATDEQIAAWKKEHGTVHEIQVEDKVAYLKKLDRGSLSLALTYLGRDNVKFAEAIFTNHFIGGCKEMEQDTDYLPGVIEECLRIVNGVKTKYVKH